MRFMVMTHIGLHMQTVNVKDRSAQTLEWKQTDRRTDGVDCITSRVLMQSV